MLIIVLFLTILAVNTYATELTCGEELSALSQSETTWKVSANAVPGAQQCRYTISGVEGHFVKITFKEIVFNAAQAKVSCDKSYVKLEGMVNTVKTEIAKLCEPLTTKVFYSPGSKLIVTIEGEQAVKNVAFNATYQSVESVESFCGTSEMNAETSDSDIWSAPKTDLQDNKICVYTIKAKPGEVVQLTLNEIASLPQNSFAIDKTQILMKLENLKDGIQTSIANITLAGGQTGTYTSTEAIMVVTLYGVAGLENPNRLFAGVYKSVTHPICGASVLQAEEGTSSTWEIPLKALDSDRQCTYTIQAQNSQVVELKITALDMGEANKKTPCSGSYLQIAETVNENDQTIENICGDEPVPHVVSSTGPMMKVTLHGDSKLKDKSVIATYLAVETCGAPPPSATENEQWIDVYTKPNDIPQSHRCTWTITASENKKVDVYLKVEEKASEKQCVLVTGANEQDPVSICRKSNSNIVTSTSPVTVQFEGSSEEIKYKSFKVYYKLAVETAADCGAVPGAATETEQSIDVYTKEDNIPKSHQCRWTITAPVNKKVDVYLKGEEESSKKQCVLVTGLNEKDPQSICRTSNNNMATKTQPVTVIFEGPGEENAYKNFQVYYKFSFAKNIVFSFANFLLSLFAICF